MADFRTHPDWKWSLEPKDDLVQDFLLPALTRARRYDRLAGFFSSSCLLVSAKGIEHLMNHVPRTEWPAYRLIVCERLTEDDVAAVQSGLKVRELREVLSDQMLRALDSPPDAAARDRLSLLAALVAVGFAEIRVAVPKGPDGRPRPGAIEHAKIALVYDDSGNVLVGFGSANETWQGWAHNNEQMDVYASWDADLWARYGENKVQRFERLWEDRDDQTLVVDLPSAVRQKLVALVPEQLPPELQKVFLENEPKPFTEAQERAFLQFIKDAPFIEGGQNVGMTTAAVDPWPHQTGIVEAALHDGFPRLLLCDEVGLGKTAEAAFVIRQLVMAGRAKRVLILTPKSILKQWQDELREKFNLHVPRYTGSELVYPMCGESVPVDGETVFGGATRMILASSELMRRETRRSEILNAPDWDIVVVDEAQHARRKGFGREDEPPNNLLELVQSLSPRTQGLLLLTATPMQIDPRELWDLLRLLGMSGKFQDSYFHFRSYYRGLAHIDEPEADLALLCDTASTSRAWDAESIADIDARAPILAARLLASLTSTAARNSLRHLPPDQRPMMRQFFLSYAPTRRLVLRTTRDMLRRYRKEGRIQSEVPSRDVQRVVVEMTREESAVYTSVEDYLGKYYVNAVSENQQGLGFVLTSYRKRLTSSMYAAYNSLLRLLSGMRTGRVKIRELLDEDEDFYDAAEAGYEDEDVIDRDVVEATQAVEEIERILHSIERLGTADTKYHTLVEVLSDLGKEHSRAIIFTQYKDTMDYLRDRLVGDITSRVACYSGRGAEVYDTASARFVEVSRDELKKRFRQESGIRYLVCTDAAAEGLNMQVCGALINYDMPWNPMRVEQRIGRVDRIGQTYSTVRIRNLFYRGTVEDDVYKVLDERINLFQQFVGLLQPILTTVQEAIQRIAMTPRADQPTVRRTQISRVVSEINRLQETAPEQPIGDDFVRPTVPNWGRLSSPVSLESLAQVVLRSPTFLRRYFLRAVDDGVYEVRWKGGVHRVTFDQGVMERKAGECRLFSFGDPMFQGLLEATTCTMEDLAALGLRRAGYPGVSPVQWFLAVDGYEQITSLEQLINLPSVR